MQYQTTITPVVIDAFDYSDADYDNAVRIDNRCAPLYPSTSADWKRWDRNRIPEHLFERFVARNADSGEMVGYGFYMHRSWAFHPRKFYFGVYVDPAWQGQGIGRKMYQHACDALAPHAPISFDTDTRSDRRRAMRFLADRGFEIKTREHSSRLELAEFNPDNWAEIVRAVDASGIVVRNLAELRRDDPAFARKLYEIDSEIDEDIPYHATLTPPPYDVWLKRFEDSPNRVEEAYLVALDGDRYVGVTMLMTNQATDAVLYTGLTGVRRTHRRRGIATALKVRALAYAKANCRTADGAIPYVMTENEENNPMFQINVTLGFKQLPDWLSYVKSIRPEEDDDPVA